MCDTKYALFVSLGSELADLKNPHVYLFPTAEEATDFAVRKLIEDGWITHVAGVFIIDKTREQFATAAEVLSEVQNWLGASEYLHIYETTTHSSQD